MSDTPDQRCARVVGALEDLVAQEAAALQASDYASVALVQERAADLISFLVTHGRDVTANPMLAERMRALQARRDETLQRLAAALSSTQEELAQTRSSQRRVAQVVPAYAAVSQPRPQLSARG